MEKITITIDGDKYCCLQGEDLQVGIAGFGDTKVEALKNFEKEYNRKTDVTEEERIIDICLDSLSNILKECGTIDLDVFRKNFLHDKDSEDYGTRVKVVGNVIEIFKSIMREEIMDLIKNNINE